MAPPRASRASHSKLAAQAGAVPPGMDRRKGTPHGQDAEVQPPGPSGTLGARPLPSAPRGPSTGRAAPRPCGGGQPLERATQPDHGSRGDQPVPVAETRGRRTHVRTRHADGRQAALRNRDLPHLTARGRAAGSAQTRLHFLEPGRAMQRFNPGARLLSRRSRRETWPGRQSILSAGRRGPSCGKPRNNRRIGKA